MFYTKNSVKRSVLIGIEEFVIRVHYTCTNGVIEWCDRPSLESSVETGQQSVVNCFGEQQKKKTQAN